MPPPLTQRDFYEANPSLENSPGDIWHGLPTQGLLPVFRSPGLVITPACDLAQRKVETITYLPIIPVRTWFSTLAALPEIKRAVDGQWGLCCKEQLIDWPLGFLPPA